MPKTGSACWSVINHGVEIQTENEENSIMENDFSTTKTKLIDGSMSFKGSSLSPCWFYVFLFYL